LKVFSKDWGNIFLRNAVLIITALAIINIICYAINPMSSIGYAGVSLLINFLLAALLYAIFFQSKTKPHRLNFFAGSLIFFIISHFLVFCFIAGLIIYFNKALASYVSIEFVPQFLGLQTPMLMAASLFGFICGIGLLQKKRRSLGANKWLGVFAVLVSSAHFFLSFIYALMTALGAYIESQGGLPH
jgi:hypothetical protein